MARPMDENCWNACVAAALGRAYVVATDPVFLRAHQTIMGKLDTRVGTMSGNHRTPARASMTRPAPPSITPSPWTR